MQKMTTSANRGDRADKKQHPLEEQLQRLVRVEHPFNYFTAGMTPNYFKKCMQNSRNLATIIPDLMLIRDVGYYKKAVQIYYESVDNQNFELVFSLFSEKVLYNRCDRRISGIDEFKRFYATTRQIRITHELASILAVPGMVAVQGSYFGTDAKGMPTSGRFMDFFRFEPAGKIEQRNTYLGAEDPSILAKKIKSPNIAERCFISNPDFVAGETMICHGGKAVPFFAEFHDIQNTARDTRTYIGVGASLIE